MDTLFPLQALSPPGFLYFPDFTDRLEEAELVKEISNIELHTFNFHGYEAKRRVASFGYDYSFEKRALSKGKEIPLVFEKLIEKVASITATRKESFGELLVTEYPIGSVINRHRDAIPFDIIAGISRAGDCTFRLRPHEKAKQTRGSVISIPVKQHSLYILQGPARTY